LTNGSLASFAYDVRNRLTGVGGLTYGYDPAGNRVGITNGGNVTAFVVNPNAALPQLLMRVQNGVTNYYVYGLGLIYEVTQTSTTNILVHHYDYRGGTVAMTDGKGNITDRVSYSPYGSITARTGANDTPFLFNGYYGVQTDANGLLSMRARFYYPTISRFVNCDPSGFNGGMNRYAYANGNPVSMVDPFGLCADKNNYWLNPNGYWADVGQELLGIGDAAVKAAQGVARFAQLTATHPFDWESIVGENLLVNVDMAIEYRDALWTSTVSDFQHLASTSRGQGEIVGDAMLTAISMLAPGAKFGAVSSAGTTATQMEFAFARGAAVQTPGVTTAGEVFVRVGATKASTAAVGYATPLATFKAIGRNSSALKNALDLPGPAPKYFRYIRPRAGTPIQRGIVPGGEYGGQGGVDEVIFLNDEGG